MLHRSRSFSWVTVAVALWLSGCRTTADKLAVLVYLAAFLLRDGETLLSTAQIDGTSLVLPNLLVEGDGTQCTVREDALKEVFYGECPDEDLTLAKLLFAPEPMAPSATPVHVTDVKFGRVPRITSVPRDNTIPLSHQRRNAGARTVSEGADDGHRSFTVFLSTRGAGGAPDGAFSRWSLSPYKTLHASLNARRGSRSCNRAGSP